MADLVTFKDGPDLTELFSRLFEKAIQNHKDFPNAVKKRISETEDENEKILVIIRHILQEHVIYFDEDFIRGIIYQGGLIGLSFPEDPVERRFEQNAIIDTLIEDLVEDNGTELGYILGNEEVDDEMEDIGDDEFNRIRDNIVYIEAVNFESLSLSYNHSLLSKGYAVVDLNNTILEREKLELQLGYFLQEFPQLKRNFLNIDNISNSAMARSDAYNALHENITNMLCIIFSLGTPEAWLLATLILDDGAWVDEDSLAKFTMNMQGHYLHYAMEDTIFISDEEKYFAGLDAIGFYLTPETGYEQGEDDLGKVIAYIDSIDVDDKDEGNRVLRLARSGGGSRNLLGLINGIKRYAFFREIEIIFENGDIVKIKDLEDEGSDWEEDFDDYDDGEEQ